MEEFQEFSELGLSKNEGKVYSTLIEHGKLSAGEVSSKSDVPYGRVYDVLDSLVHKGLVEIVPEETKKYIPGNPDSFLKLVEEKEKTLAKIKDKVKELKQFYDSKGKPPVEMVLGKKAFYTLIKEIKRPDKSDYTIKWNVQYLPEWAENSKKKVKRGVDMKVLARDDKETEENLKDWMKVHKNFRKMDNEGVALSITDEDEVMLGLIKSNVTLLIRDKPFAKIMKKLFLSYYDQAEKIE